MWQAVLFYCCDLFLYFFILFRQPNLGRPWTDLAEIWYANQKLMRFMNAGPKWGLTPQEFFFWGGAKIWQISNGAYSYELITLERKRISARLKWLCNRNKMAYIWHTFDLDLWPLDVNIVSAYTCTSVKISCFLRFSQNFLLNFGP